MRWVSLMLLAGTLAVGMLVRSDRASLVRADLADAPTEEEDDGEPGMSYDFQSVVYGVWRLDFARPFVVWSAQDEDDVVVLPVKVTCVSSVRRTLFADVESFAAYPADKTGIRDALGVAQGYDSAGDPLCDTSEENQGLVLGESVKLRFAWKVAGNYDAIRLDVQGYSVSAYETSISLADLEETAEHQQAQAALEARKAAADADIGGAVVVRPAGWRFDAVSDTSVTLLWETGTGGTVEVTYRDYSTASPNAEANKYMGRYGEPAPVVMAATVGENEWAYFVPADGQFLAWTQARPGLVEARGAQLEWDEAAEAIAAITVR